MAYFATGKKVDLMKLADELRVDLPEDARIIDIKNLIMGSEGYNEEFTKGILKTIVTTRTEEEKREQELADRDREDRERERMFELEKLKIGNGKGVGETKNDVELNTNFSLRKIMQRYDIKDGDISFYLVLFERQAKRLKLKQEDWVGHLVNLLPYEINQLIAREPEEKYDDYTHIKELLLKRFKLSPDKFRQKFFEHSKLPKSTWKDFTYELQNYFNEWLNGMQVEDFEALSELIITDQLKKKVPNAVKEHFVDDWVKFVKSTELAEKLDEYDNVRGLQSENRHGKINMKNPFNEMKYKYGNDRMRNEINNVHKNDFPYNNSKSSFSKVNTYADQRKAIRNEKQISCFVCGGPHYARNCSKQKAKFIDMKSEKTDNGAKTNSTRSIDVNQNLTVTDNKLGTASPYFKSARINNSPVAIECLIDTGSACCLLKESVAERLKLSVQPATNQLFGFGNSQVCVATAVGKTHADVSIDDVVGENVEILIVKDTVTPYDLLIGRTYLDLENLTFARIGKKFHIRYAAENPFANTLYNSEPQRIELKTAKEVRLESNSINFVKAKTDLIDNGLVVIEGAKENVDSLLEIVEGETIVPIANVGKDNIVIAENTCISRVHEVNKDCIISDDNFSVNAINETKRSVEMNEIKFDESITFDKKKEILELINKYRDCIALTLSELGCTKLTKMDIREVDGSKPVSARPYKTNATERKIIKDIVKEWKEYGIVSETRSPYASPVLLVKKKTGEHRLVVDYRKLNSQTIKDKFPLPKIDDLLECLGDCKIFTTLDLAHGYLQIPLSEEAKLKTAFITPDETGQFERMIFGLSNAPSEFQRLMRHVLGPLLNTKALCYLDDILIPARTWEEMIDRITEVFECLRRANLTLKLSKCEFGKTEVDFLGFLINEDGLKPGSRKIKAVENFPKPENVHDIRRFLGLTGFFRRFIPKYAQKAEPLSRLTQKNKEFQWKEEQEKAFHELRKQLVVQPTLVHYRPDAVTEVHTDASSEGLSGLLIQKGTDNRWHLVYAVSKKTTEVEKKYHSSKLELMAIVWTLDRLRQFLLGIKFTIVTDCQALVYMNAKKSTNPQIARWSNLIQEYDFEVKHRPGKQMAHVDAMSRAPVSEPDDTLTTIIERNLEVCLTLNVDEQVLLIQHADSELKKLISIFKKEKHERSKVENQLIEGYVFKRNRLYRSIKEKEEEKLLYVIPKSMRKSTVVKFHDLMGHFGVDRTVNKIKELYWFPRMKRYVRKHISMCLECLVNKVPGGKQQGFLHPIKPGKRPFSIIHIDHLGPFVKSSRGNQDLLVIIDNFTRFVRLTPVKSTKLQYVLKALTNFVNEFGLPDRIISDRGSSFTAQKFEEYCQTNGIVHTLNSTKHPQGNGMVERINRTIIPTISISMEDNQHKDWDAKIKEVERNLNNMVNKTTNKTPFEMLHGYTPRFHDGILRRETDDSTVTWTNPEDVQAATRNRIEEQQRKMKANYDKKKCRSTVYEPGEIVVMKRSPVSTGQPTKTQPKYRGPLIVTDVLPSDTYRVTQLEEKKRGHFYSTTAHVSQLKPWRCPDDSDDDDYEDSCDDSSEDEDEPNLEPRRNPRRLVPRPDVYGK